MSDLTARLNEITSRQDTTNLKLDALITAAGGAPPAAGATLTDVVAAITATNTRLDALLTAANLTNTQLTTIANAQINASNQLVLIRTLIEPFFDDYFSGDGAKQLFENIAFGTLETRNAVLATFCGCEGVYTPIPPLLTGSVPANLQEHCRRTQFQLDRFEDMLDNLVVQLRAGGAISAVFLASLFAAGAIAAGVTVPPSLVLSFLASFGDLREGAAAQARDAFVASKTALRQAIYNAPDAAAAKAAFDAAASTNITGGGGTFAGMIKLLAWSSWFNDIYNTAVPMATTGYSGTVCASNWIGHTAEQVRNGNERIMLWSNTAVNMVTHPQVNQNLYLSSQVANKQIRNTSPTIAIECVYWNSAIVLQPRVPVPINATATFPANWHVGYVYVATTGFPSPGIGTVQISLD